MAGETIVFFAKYTTLVDTRTYYSDPYEVTGYRTINVETFMAGVNGAPTTVVVTLQQSSDLITWSDLDTGTLAVNTPDTMSATGPARYVRCTVAITGGTSPAVTLWCKGVARDA
jgi:hypothetical protein